jgi:hypothetical protein
VKSLRSDLSANSRAGRTSGGCLATVEVEPELETPTHPAAGGGVLISRSLAKGPTESHQASQLCSQRSGSHLFEPANAIGTKTVTENNLRFLDF